MKNTAKNLHFKVSSKTSKNKYQSCWSNSNNSLPIYQPIPKPKTNPPYNLYYLNSINSVPNVRVYNKMKIFQKKSRGWPAENVRRKIISKSGPFGNKIGNLESELMREGEFGWVGDYSRLFWHATDLPVFTVLQIFRTKKNTGLYFVSVSASFSVECLCQQFLKHRGLISVLRCNWLVILK